MSVWADVDRPGDAPSRRSSGRCTDPARDDPRLAAHRAAGVRALRGRPGVRGRAGVPPGRLRRVPRVPHGGRRHPRRRRRHRHRGTLDQGRAGPRPGASSPRAAVGRAVAGHHHRGRRPAAPSAPPTRCSRRSRSRRRAPCGCCAPRRWRTSSSPSARRSRHVRLRTPPPEAVAELLVRRDGIDPPMAMYAARAAQSHVGLARRLARDEGARIRRRDVIALAGQIRGVGDAVDAAADLASIADEESSPSATERDAAERARLLETLGADPSARTQPPHVRSQVAALEQEQKTRATRFARDVVDRSLVDLLSVYRDALVLHTGASRRPGQPGHGRPRPAAGRRPRARAAAAGHGRDRHGPRADRRQRAAAAGARGDGDLAAAARARSAARPAWATGLSAFRDTVGRVTTRTRAWWSAVRSAGGSRRRRGLAPRGRSRWSCRLGLQRHGSAAPAAPSSDRRPRPRARRPRGQRAGQVLRPDSSTWKTCDSFRVRRAHACRWTTPSPTVRPSPSRCSRPRPSGQHGAGSLVVNPGGPGGSGVDYAARGRLHRQQAGARQLRHRRVRPARGRLLRSPVTAWTTASSTPSSAPTRHPTTQAEEQAFVASAKAFADGVRGQGRPAAGARLAPIDAAKDMDILRAALGDAKLNYLGKSYGTFLGATYADLFPQRSGGSSSTASSPPT